MPLPHSSRQHRDRTYNSSMTASFHIPLHSPSSSSFDAKLPQLQTAALNKTQRKYKLPPKRTQSSTNPFESGEKKCSCNAGARACVRCVCACASACLSGYESSRGKHIPFRT